MLGEDKICTPGEPVSIFQEQYVTVKIVRYLCCNTIHSEILRRDDVAFQSWKNSSKNMGKKALYSDSNIKVP